MRINRLFETVYLLLNKKTMTAKQLSEHFEVSTRTIYRDIDVLSSAGIPLYQSRGKGGGIHLMDHYILNKSLLSDREQEDILSALQALSALQVPAIDPMIKKLGAIFNKKNHSWIDIDFSHWESSHQEREKFDCLKTAILSSKKISFEYCNFYGEESSRLVEPLQIYFKEASWYLKSFCTKRQDYRIFKILRIANLKMTEESFSRDLGEAKNICMPSKKMLTFKLKFSNVIANRIEGEYHREQIKKDSQGNLLLSIDLPYEEWTLGYLMSYGPWCEVLEPLHIREIIKKRFEQALKNYV